MKILVNGESFEIEVLSRKPESVKFSLNNRTYEVQFEKSVSVADSINKNVKKTNSQIINKDQTSPKERGERVIIAPMFGVVASVLVSQGDTFETGDVLLRIEAMKMQNNIYAPTSGVVNAVHVKEGDEVSDGQLLLEIA